MAYEFATGGRLASGDFEGGKSGAVKVLGSLGFTVERADPAAPPGRCYRTAVPMSPFLVTREASSRSSMSSAPSARSGSTR